MFEFLVQWSVFQTLKSMFLLITLNLAVALAPQSFVLLVRFPLGHDFHVQLVKRLSYTSPLSFLVSTRSWFYLNLWCHVFVCIALNISNTFKVFKKPLIRMTFFFVF